MDSIKELKTFLEGLSAFGDENRENRIKRAKKDFRFFVLTYFSHHIGSQKEMSYFRNFIYDNIQELSKKNRKILLKAYRGAAKTTIITKLYSLFLILTLKKRYCILISSTLDLAKENIEFIATECEFNASLKQDFNITPFSAFTQEEITLKIGDIPVKFKSFGANKKIRGTNFLSIRPDLIICDDIENDENVATKTQRQKLLSWFNKAILKLPSRLNQDYNILVVGTTLHFDSLLESLSKRSDFLTLSFPLVRNFPSNIQELTKENLKQFIPEDMLLDDERIEKIGVLSDFLEDKASFYSEMQNTPFDTQDALLGDFETYEVLPEFIDCIFIGIDPSLGKARGDYFAISILYYNKTQKKIFWEAHGYKVSPDKMIEKILHLVLNLKNKSTHISLAIEIIAFQEFFKDELKKAFLNINFFIPIIPIRNNTHKNLRLDALSPLLKNREILIYENSHLLKEECQTYPKCPHDDLLDSGDIALQAFNLHSLADYKSINKAIKKFTPHFKKIKQKY